MKIWRYISAGNFDIGPLAVYPWNNGHYRPCVWLTLPSKQVAIFFGWQKPTLMVMER